MNATVASNIILWWQYTVALLKSGAIRKTKLTGNLPDRVIHASTILNRYAFW